MSRGGFPEVVMLAAEDLCDAAAVDVTLDNEARREVESGPAVWLGVRDGIRNWLIRAA